jgi:hypothetical protein
MKRSVHYGLLAVLALVLLLPQLGTIPPAWFDEGYNTHAANMLARQGFYGTYTTDGYALFDSSISSGPPIIIPAALSFSLFGTGFAQARLVSVIYTVLALWGIYGLCSRLYSREAGFFIALFLLVFPAPDTVNFLFVGRQFLGETAALTGVIFGLWLWCASWDNQRWSFRVLAGMLFGLALLTKPHVGIVLAPTLFFIAAFYGLRHHAGRSQWLALFTPIVVMLAVFAAWMLLQRIATAGHPPRPGTLDFLNAMKISLFAGLFGRPLPAEAYKLIAVMVLVVVVTGWRLARATPRLMTNRDWGEAVLLLCVLLTVLWYGLLSLGWPRYAHAGFNISLLLLGKFGWDVFAFVRQRLRWPVLKARSLAVATAGLTLLILVLNGYPLIQTEGSDDVQAVAQFIEREIPPDAVIESWAWELDATSRHVNFHHPNQNYLYVATEQHFVQSRPFDLDYDALQADPDYLISETFSQWTMLYDPDVLAENFELIAEFGNYHVYRRIRS